MIIIKYEQWAKEKGIFRNIADNNPNSIINEVGAEQTESIFRIYYSKRLVSSNVEEEGVSNVAETVDTLFSDQWEKYKTILKYEMPVSAERVETVTDRTTNTTDKDVTTDTDNKTSAYDNDTMVEDTSTKDSMNENSENKVDKENEKEVKTLTALEKQMELNFRQNMIKWVCQDVANFLFLSIY